MARSGGSEVEVVPIVASRVDTQKRLRVSISALKLPQSLVREFCSLHFCGNLHGHTCLTLSLHGVLDQAYGSHSSRECHESGVAALVLSNVLSRERDRRSNERQVTPTVES